MQMQKAIIGKKVGMTQIFDESGKVIPVTVIEAGPCVVTQKKTVENDGYSAVQLGYEDVKESKLTKPELGHLKLQGRCQKPFSLRLPTSSAIFAGLMKPIPYLKSISSGFFSSRAEARFLAVISSYLAPSVSSCSVREALPALT